MAETKCNRFREVLSGSTGMKVSKMGEFLIHIANCKDCSVEYDKWYYSPENPYYEVYYLTDAGFRAKVEEIKDHESPRRNDMIVRSWICRKCRNEMKPHENLGNGKFRCLECGNILEIEWMKKNGKVVG